MSVKDMTVTDHALAVVKAALNLDQVTGVGGALASLIDDYVPTARERQREEAMKRLVEKVDEVKARIKIETVNKAEFAELYNQFEDIARKTNREEKLTAAANIVANALLGPDDAAKSSFDELDHFMHCVDALSVGAISALGAAIKVNPPRHTSGGDAPVRPNELARLMGRDLHLVMGLASELRSLNLLHVTEGVINSRSYESWLLRVTPMGARLAQQFIEGRM
jgi:hypothetical protein